VDGIAFPDAAGRDHLRIDAATALKLLLEARTDLLHPGARVALLRELEDDFADHETSAEGQPVHVDATERDVLLHLSGLEVEFVEDLLVLDQQVADGTQAAVGVVLHAGFVEDGIVQRDHGHPLAGTALEGCDGTGHRGGLYRSLVRVLAAPDKFRGTLTSTEAAAAIGAGWRRGRPDDAVEQVPLADGGEGTLEALVAAGEGRVLSERVTGPLGDPIDAEFGLVDRDRTGVVEMARASGLALVPDGRRDALHATTRGTGELILAAARNRPERIVVCIGGSATTDGGAGMAQALGARLLDASGRDVPPGGAGLLELDRIDTSELDPAVRGCRFRVASDVDNPLVGPEGAAAVYGPQKGANARDVELLDRALTRYAEVLRRDLGVDVADRPGAGAAGGLGAGLMAFLEAELRPGIEVVMEAARFDERLPGAELVVTGEGKLDAQSLHGKTVAGVHRAAEEAGIRVLVVCGQATIRPDGVRVESLAEAFGIDRALRDTRAALEELLADVARRWPG
jgi:glycerate 2-kinase